jgi:ADP-dependent NAD(P)H-hydrate dehydratase / NAD(P)H-hydrate epimerase
MWADFGRPLTSLEMEVVEANAGALGVSIDALMERAGRAVAEEATRHLPGAPARVAIVTGSGNNGGDGTCAAHYLLEWGYRPEVWMIRPPTQIYSHSARRCFERVASRLPVHLGLPTVEELTAFPLVVDALLGTGQTGPLRSPYTEAVRAIVGSRVPTLAVDLPTGTRDPAGLVPSWTISLTAPKAEMDPTRAGEVVVRDIGIPVAAWAETGAGEFLFYPTLPLSAHGRRARVVVIGGGPYAGAPALAGLAALRSGAERATIVTPGGTADLVQGFSPNLVVRGFGDRAFGPPDVDPILQFLDHAPPAAVILGMGAGADPATLEALGRLETALVGRFPLVVDADALRPLPAVLTGAKRGSNPVIATPNVGEFVRNFGGDRESPLEKTRHHVQSVANRYHLTLVQKGDPDVISDGVVTVENRRHSPFQTVAGAGDVLGGVIGSLLAQGLAPVHAARLATYWVGESGIRSAGGRGAGLLATDVIEELPATLVAGLGRVRHAE